MTNIDEVRKTCQKENRKTTPSMFISCWCLNVNVGSVLYCRQVARCFCVFSETYDSKFEFWNEPEQILELKSGTLLSYLFVYPYYESTLFQPVRAHVLSKRLAIEVFFRIYIASYEYKDGLQTRDAIHINFDESPTLPPIKFCLKSQGNTTFQQCLHTLT